jgi:hypothetical protein
MRIMLLLWQIVFLEVINFFINFTACSNFRNYFKGKGGGFNTKNGRTLNFSKHIFFKKVINTSEQKSKRNA